MNAIHSVDALVLRNMHRRCNYNESNVRQSLRFLQEAGTEYEAEDTDLDRLIELAEINQWFDPIFLDRIDTCNVYSIPVYIRHKLIKLAEEMLVHPPFPLVTVHDAFGSHATNCNRVRYWYKEIMAELNESSILTSIWNQLGKSGSFKKQDIADKIRNSNYGLA